MKNNGAENKSRKNMLAKNTGTEKISTEKTIGREKT